MILNDTLLKAISWTLVHSVWQGFLLALGAGIVIFMTRKSSASLRYNLLSSLFLSFIIMVGFTFDYEFQNENTEVTTRLNLPINQLNTSIGNISTNGNVVVVSDNIISFLNRHADTIALIWFLIFCIKCFGIFTGMSHIYKIRNYKTFSPPEYWSKRLEVLTRRIHIRKPVVLLESTLVKVPLVTGFFKPILLVPFGLLTSLPEDQIEAILLHELAHIRRKDYGINLLQAFAETIFFFNPGVLWLSSLIKEERENCCDDIAIDATENKINFVQALVTFEAYNRENIALAIGFGGANNHLLRRAKRIIYNNNKSLNIVEKAFLATSLLLTLIIVIACSNPKISNVAIPIMPIDILSTKAVPEPLCSTNNTSAIFPKTEAYYDAIEVQKAAIEVAKADEETRKADEATRKADDETRKADDETRKADDEARKADDEARFYDDQASKAERQAQKYATTAKSVTTRTVLKDTKSAKTFEKEVTENNTKKVSIRTGISGEDLPENLNVDQLTSNIISDLIVENIIKDTKNLSYKLSKDNLIVNGKVQAENMFRKIRQKYIKSQYHSICYNYSF
ncbi:M56 family metallopeptidase [Flavobacterium sp.]|uniref:M56 family metallopeptidase n=1 Tax=Flavobacterium sp. TaxID=239 RepID=UPI00286B4607|nr:M56 family metallopeptidase [Flavobacterium sp.]